MERKATEELKAAGFKGLIPVSELREGGSKMIPDVPGVYMVLRVSEGAPEFLETGRAGETGRTLGWKVYMAARRCFAAPVLLERS